MQGLGKEQISLGSAPDDDVFLQGPGIAPHHARIVRLEGGLQFIDQGVGPSFANGAPVGPRQPCPFDLRTTFMLGQVAVPAAHPAIVRMLLSPGQIAAPRGQIIIGREPSRASLVIGHPTVSGQHATVMLDRVMVVDHGSTSGTWIAGQRIPPNQPVPIDPNGFVSFGLVTVPVALLMQIAQAAAVGSLPPVGGSAVLPATPMPQPGAAPSPFAAPVGSQAMAATPEPAHAAPRKHRTIIGELSLDQLASAPITIGRTPENQIVVAHPQVSSRHAQIVREGASLFVEDRGSANGTYVRGQRIPPGQRVPVEHGEKVYIGPMPLLIQIAGQQINVVVEDQAAWAGKPLFEIEAWDLFLEVPDRDQPGVMKVLLDHVSFKALPGRHDRAHGAVGRGQDHAPAHPERLPAPDRRAGPHQRRGPLPHLRRPARVHRLRPAGRHRPPRAHGLRGGHATRRSSACLPTTRTRRSTAASRRP